MSDVACVIASSLAEAQRQGLIFSDGTMTTTVTITRRGNPGGLDYTTGLVIDPDTTIYTGKARVSRTTGDVPMLLGDEQEYFQHVEVSIPLSAPQVIIDDMVEITSSKDPHVVGRLFRVTDTVLGGDIPTAQTVNGIGVARSRTNP